MGILTTTFKVRACGPKKVRAQARYEKLLGVAHGEDLSSHARRIVGAKELPGLRITSLSLHLAHYPGSFGRNPCAPLVGPFSSGTLFGPLVTASFKKERYISPLLPG